MTDAPLWTANEIAGLVGAQIKGDWSATGISIDSRTIAPGDLFVALAGPNFDGHDYVADAFDRHAVAAMVQRRPDGLSDNAPLVLVDDTLAALAALGRGRVAETSARIVAITGSVGKTGTKEALRHVLSQQAPTAANEGNLNNHIGVPLSLARMPRESVYGVFELGMNHAGEIAPLSKLVRPDVAIITTIAAVHAEAFDSVHDIAEAKGEIFAGMGPDGVAILNRDNAFFHVLAGMAARQGITRIVGFGAHPEAQSRLVDCRVEGASTSVSAIIGDRSMTYRLGLAGRHHAINSLSVLAAVEAVGGDVGAAAVALSDISPEPGRGRRHLVPLDGGTVTVIDDSYNASPASMRAAFATLSAARTGPGGRRIAVLGDMLELGPQAPGLHAALAGPLTENGCDLVLAAGPEMTHLVKVLPSPMVGGHAPTSDELVDLLMPLLRDGDVVLVKGSHGIRMDRIVDALLALGAPAATAVNGR